VVCLLIIPSAKFTVCARESTPCSALHKQEAAIFSIWFATFAHEMMRLPCLGAAVVKAKAGPSKPPLFTEEDWNDEATPETTDGAYYLSKVSRAAWHFSCGNLRHSFMTFLHTDI